jgi:hypothetical protein
MATNYVLVDFENVQPDMSALAGTANRVIVFFGAKQQEGRVKASTMLALIRLGPNVEIVELLRSGKNALDMHIAFQIGRIFETEPDASVHIVSGDTDFDPLIEYLKKTKGTRISRSKDVGVLAKQQRPTPPAALAMGAVPRKAKASAVRKPQPQRAPQVQKVAQAQRALQPQKVPQPQKAPQPQKVSQPQRPQSQKLPQPQRLPQSQKSQSPKSPPPPSKLPSGQPPHLEQVVKQLRSMSGKPSTRRKLEQTIASYFKHHGGEQPELVQRTIDELIRGGLVAQAGTKVTYQLG